LPLGSECFHLRHSVRVATAAADKHDNRFSIRRTSNLLGFAATLSGELQQFRMAAEVLRLLDCRLNELPLGRAHSIWNVAFGVARGKQQQGRDCNGVNTAGHQLLNAVNDIGLESLDEGWLHVNLRKQLLNAGSHLLKLVSAMGISSSVTNE